jgi:hypothetical protein
MDVSGQLHGPAALPTRKNSGTHSTGGSVCPTQPIWTFQNEGKNLFPMLGFETRFVQTGTKKNSATNRVLRSFSVSAEILTAVGVNATLLWEMTPCSFADKNVPAKPPASIIKVGV